MKQSKIAGMVLVSAVAVGGLFAWLHAEPQVSVTTQPATQPTTKPVSISPEAQKELDALSAAYSKLTHLETAGSIEAVMDIAGERNTRSATFSSSYQSPNRFRHSTMEDLLIGSTGEKNFLYIPGNNSFYQVDAAKTKADFSKERTGASAALDEQNPAMLLVLSDPPTKLLLDDATDVIKADDVKIGEKSYPAILIRQKKQDLRLAMDPETHLIRQAQRDVSRDLINRGAPDVKTATVTYDFTTVNPSASTREEQFAWAPPADAKDATTRIGRELLMGDNPGEAMVGKPAPTFTLGTLDDKKASLADTKGNVVVLDFWATWCGPCVAGLPHVDKLYADKKDAGLRVFAINQAEDKDEVAEFVEKKGWKLPVLLDTDEKVGEAYMVQGIPHQVVIGKDGNVKKVIVGFNPNEPDALRKIVEEELSK